MANDRTDRADRTQSAQVKKNSRAEEWLKSAIKDKHVRMIPFSEISKVKYNVAKGGSGTIHLGAWRNMHVAIKEQHNTNDLIKELKMHKQVHDSNYIVKFFGITKHPLTQDTCIVMQFAENGCLQDYLETRNVTITWLTKYRLAWEVSSGLDFIHRENIFHTDLHSRNILIDTHGKALITDFGLSKSVNKTIYTTKAGLFGVVPYVAPERMQNPTYTYNAKCDIYSLGVIFWELSSCVIPFEVQLQDVMLAVNIIAGVREKTVAGTAVEYEMLYRRCWDGLPQNRPTMDIVLSELVELLAAEQINPRSAAPRPISPRPPRPLSSESMVAPSTPFPYDNDPALQSSPENTTPMRPASPPSAKPGPSNAKGLSPGSHDAGPNPAPRPDRTGVRVSFVDQPREMETVITAELEQDYGDDQFNANAPKPSTPNMRLVQAPILDSPAATMVQSAVSESQSAEQPRHLEPVEPVETTSERPGEETPQLLPPISPFQALTLTTPSEDNPIPAIVEPNNNSVLPETASLFRASGLSMVSVMKNLRDIKAVNSVSTISPPPPGAPPPPPTSTGQAHSPRVISPPAGRPKVISPSKPRNAQAPLPHGRVSKTISPPTGAQGRIAPPPPPGTPPPGTPPIRPSPSPSPSLNPIPKPPSGPPPSPTPYANPPPIIASSLGVLRPTPMAMKSMKDTPRTAVSPIVYVPATTYSPSASKTKPNPEKNKVMVTEKKDPESSRSSPSPEPRPAPSPMGFPVVPPLDPHVFPPRLDQSPPGVQPPPPSPGAPPMSGQKNSRQIDVGGIGSSHRFNSPDLTRRENDLRISRPIELNGTSSPGVSSAPNMSPRTAQGFFPVVDNARAGHSKARDPKSEENGSTVKDATPPSQSAVPPSSNAATVATCTTATATSGTATATATTAATTATTAATPPPSKPRVQFDNFYSLSDPYKDLNVDEPSDFFTAITQGDLETVERMLKSHPSLIDEKIGFWPFPTALLVAARSRHTIETMKILVKYGAALDRGDQNGTTVLHSICEQFPNPTEVIVFLTKAGADCNSRDSKKRTPLMLLLQNTHIQSTKVLVECMRVLFKFGALTKVADHQNQRTPLHYAIQHCKEPATVIELLLKKGAEVNAIDSRKSTSLHMVLERMDNEELVQMLLLYGADPSLKNSTKRNALCIAAENLRVMSAWFLLENDLLSSAPETIKKASELCSKADGPDKSSKPLFKNLLSDWQGKEGKLRRIQLAQDCVFRVQRTPDMKTIDQTQVAIEFLESAGVPLQDPEKNNSNPSIHNSNSNNNSSVNVNNINGSSSSNNNNNNNNGIHGTNNDNGITDYNTNNNNNSGINAINGGGPFTPALAGGAGGAPGLLRLNGVRSNSEGSLKNNNNHNNHGVSNNSVGPSSMHHHHHHHHPQQQQQQHHHHHHHHQYHGNGHVQVKELRLAEGVEPLKQTMLPVKSVQQLEKEREAFRNQMLYSNMGNSFGM